MSGSARVPGSGNTRRLLTAFLTVVFLGALASLAGVAWHGGFVLRCGGLRLLSVHSAALPALFAVLALLLLYRRLDPRSFGRHLGSVDRTSWVAILVSAGLVWQALRQPSQVYGDGIEYILQTQAIVLQRSLVVDTEHLRDYWNRTNPFGVVLGDTAPPGDRLDAAAQAGGGFGGLYPDRNRQYRYYHFWGYSAAVAPLYALLHVLYGEGPAEYAAFPLFNVICLFLPLAWAWCRRSLAVSRIMLGLALCSPWIGYLSWTHPELYCFGLVFMACALAGTPWGRVAPILLALAAAQNPPVLLFLPLLVYRLLVFHAAHNVRAFLRYIPGACAIILGLGWLLPALYWYAAFGTWNAISAVGGARLDAISPSRIAHVFFSPLNGALVFYPAIFLGLPAALRRDTRIGAWGLIACTLAAVALCTASTNFNSAQVGAIRYSTWLFAPAACAVLANPGIPWCNLKDRLLAVAAVVGSCGIILMFGLYRIPWGEHVPFDACHRIGPETAAAVRILHYPEDPETLAENIRGRELTVPTSFDGIYIWNLGPADSVWIVPRRALLDLGHFEWHVPALPPFHITPPQSPPWIEGTGGVRFAVSPQTVFEDHPVWGGFLRIWVKAAVRAKDISTDAPCVIRP